MHIQAEHGQQSPVELASCHQPLLISLPDLALEMIARHLTPRSTASLLATCQHMQGFMTHEGYVWLFDKTVFTSCCCHQLTGSTSLCRLWQEKLKSCYPVWAASDVKPSVGASHGQSWRQLIATATTLQPPGLHNSPFMWPDFTAEMTMQLWNSGQSPSKCQNFPHSL